MKRRTFVGSAAAAGLMLTACGPKEAAKKAAPAKASDLKILILGGTGFLGPALVEAARGKHTLTLFNRGKTRPHLFPDIEKLQGDRDGKLDALKGRQWDAVVDTSGYVPRIVKMSAELLAPNVKQYVFISSVSVYGENLPKPGTDETAPVGKLADPTVEKMGDQFENYGPLKALCEQAAETAMPGRVTNIRPGLIVGPDDPTDRFTYWPVRFDKGGDVLCPGDGTDPMQQIDVRDLAKWIILTLENKTVGVFNALGPADGMAMKSFVDACAKATTTPSNQVWVPTEFLEKQEVMPWMELPGWVPGTGETAGFGRMSNARAVAAGLKLRPLETTAKDTLTWWKTLPEERRKKMRGLDPKKEADVLAAWAKEKKG